MAILWVGSAAVVPTVIRLVVDHLVSDVTIFPAYFPFVLAAATFLGWRSAVATAILSALAANFMFMGPRFAFSTVLTDVVSTLMFLLSAGVVIYGVERLKSAASIAGPEYENSPSARRPLARGPGLLLAVVLALVTWVAVIWGAVRAVRMFT